MYIDMIEQVLEEEEFDYMTTDTVIFVDAEVQESDIVTLEIISTRSLTATGVYSPHVTGLIRIDLERYADGSRIRVEDTIDTYEVMSASLFAPAFTVDVQANSKRSIKTGAASWTWQVTAKQAGEQSLTVEIFGHPEDTEGEGAENLVSLKTFSQEVAVTDIDAIRRVSFDQWIAIFGQGGILGALGLWLGLKQKKDKSDTEKKIAELQARWLIQGEDDSNED